MFPLFWFKKHIGVILHNSYEQFIIQHTTVLLNLNSIVMSENVFYGKVADHYLEDNETIYHVMKEEIVIYDLDTAKQFLAERLSFAKGKDYAMIFDCTNIKSFNMEAQKFDASDEALEGITFMAVIIKSKIQQLLGNIYMAMQKPKVPTKLFSNKEDCKKWIKKQRIAKAA